VHHEIALISTIAVGLVYALIAATFASRLRLPPFVGYPSGRRSGWNVYAGFVADAKLAPQLAEIGVICSCSESACTVSPTSFCRQDGRFEHQYSVFGTRWVALPQVAQSFHISGVSEFESCSNKTRCPRAVQ